MTLDAIKTGANSILVCALQLEGKGDIYGAYEIRLRVQKLLPHLKVVFTVLKPCFNATEALMFGSEGKEFVDLAEIQKQEGWEIAKSTSVLKTIGIFRSIIVFPTYHDSLLPPEILSRNEIVIKLREYSSGTPLPQHVKGVAYTLGLNKRQDEKGVLLPMKYTEKLPSVSESDSIKRLSHLQKVDAILSRQILGLDYSFAAVDAFDKSSKLYLAYFNQSEVFFCYINALLSCKKSNLVIHTTQTRPENLIPKLHRTLWQQGFGSINVLEFTDSTHFKLESRSFKTIPPKEKKCTIIFRPLSSIEMDAMLEASEDESLATGDLSPFRFLAHRKTLAYDTREHKRESAEAMIELAAKFDNRFEKLLWNAYFSMPDMGTEFDPEALKKGMIQFFMAMDSDSSLKANWNRFIDEIFTHHDFGPELAKILKDRTDLLDIVD